MFLHNRASLTLSLLLLVVKEEEVGVSSLSFSFSVAKPEIERFLPDLSPKSRNRGEGGGPRAAEKILLDGRGDDRYAVSCLHRTLIISGAAAEDIDIAPVLDYGPPVTTSLVLVAAGVRCGLPRQEVDLRTYPIVRARK